MAQVNITLKRATIHYGLKPYLPNPRTQLIISSWMPGLMRHLMFYSAHFISIALMVLYYCCTRIIDIKGYKHILELVKLANVQVDFLNILEK